MNHDVEEGEISDQEHVQLASAPTASPSIEQHRTLPHPNVEAPALISESGQHALKRQRSDVANDGDRNAINAPNPRKRKRKQKPTSAAPMLDDRKTRDESVRSLHDDPATSYGAHARDRGNAGPRPSNYNSQPRDISMGSSRDNKQSNAQSSNAKWRAKFAQKQSEQEQAYVERQQARERSQPPCKFWQAGGCKNV